MTGAATLYPIAATLLFGFCVTAVSLSLFGFLISRNRRDIIAPRALSRPVSILHNVLDKNSSSFMSSLHMRKSKSSSTSSSSSPSSCIWYTMRWIPWTLKLTYQRMLDGIPGTGSRDDGYSGTRLRCNLDALILLRFHALGLRIAVVSTILCLFVTLPIIATTKCDSNVLGENFCKNQTDLTDFERLTLAHIPQIPGSNDASTSTPYGSSDDIDSPKVEVDSFKSEYTFRLYAVVVVAWIIYIFTCVMLWREWIDNLALRRVFYLEYDHWKERRYEMNAMENAGKSDDGSNEDDDIRPPWLPHADVRETVPNISLYSVLYRLPKKPHRQTFPKRRSQITTEIESSDDEQSSLLFTQTSEHHQPHNFKYEMDWQLSVTTNFFDQCVPNQPGFSSSIAAVTILPHPKKLSLAWGKWYACATRVRRLQLIRQQMKLKTKLELENLQQQQTRLQQMNQKQLRPREEATKVKLESIEPLEESSRSSNGHEATEIKEMQAHKVSTMDAASNETDSTPPVASPSCCAETWRLWESAEVGGQNVEPIDNQHEESMENITDTDHDGMLDSRCQQAPAKQPHVSQQDIMEKESLDCTEEGSPGEKSAKTDDASDTEEAIQDNTHDCIHGKTASNDAARPRTVEVNDKAVKVSRSSFLERTRKMRNDKGYKSKERAEYFAKYFGLPQEEKLDMFLSQFGVEQMSVFSLEFARSSALCSYGTDESWIRRRSLEELREMEGEAVDDVREANVELYLVASTVQMPPPETEDDENDPFYDSSSSDEEFSEPDELEEHESKIAEEDEKAADQIGESMIRYESEETYGEIDIEAGESKRSKSGLDPHIVIRSKKDIRKGARLRRRGSIHQWERVNRIVCENSVRGRNLPSNTRSVISGRWNFGWKLAKKGKKMMKKQLKRAVSQPRKMVRDVVDHSTYAVVTFTSRQAAIAARQCQADGNGFDRWCEVEDIPVPPLADAAPFNCWTGRGLCRPVTLTLTDDQKWIRKVIVHTLLFLFCCFYTVPLSAASSIFSSANFEGVLGFLSRYQNISESISGIVAGSLYSLFFSICPYLFLSLAHFGSGTTSVRGAEREALLYYWGFMLLIAFTGQSLATMVLNYFSKANKSLGLEAQEVLREVAKTIPTQVSASWLSWIIVQSTIIWPVMYLCQGPNLFFTLLGMRPCARMTKGGGAGGNVPYRVYVDSSVVFMCIVALAPACPLVAPGALIYFLVLTPVLRWHLLFVYRPNHDGGGQRWPLLFEFYVSAMIWAQLLLTTMMALKKAFGPAILAGVPILPTFLFSMKARARFLTAYEDAGLLQTSQLDGWSRSEITSKRKREDFLAWLVDCHKASYVPICMAGVERFLTAEPAVVVPTIHDTDLDDSALNSTNKESKKARSRLQKRLTLEKSIRDTTYPSTGRRISTCRT